MRKLTIIESPYGSDDAMQFHRNCNYLQDVLRHSWEMGELPFASHAFFPFFLKESKPEERKAGIEAGYLFWDMMHVPRGANLGVAVRPLIVFYCDLGISRGMKLALERVQVTGHKFEIRHIHPVNMPQPIATEKV